MIKTTRYRLVSDDDGHDFLIPADKGPAWAKWLQSEDAQDGIVPKWARPVEVHLLTFENPVEEDPEPVETTREE